MKSAITNTSLIGAPSANQAQLFVMGKGEILEANKPSLNTFKVGGKGERI